jgi:hypothetical protein
MLLPATGPGAAPARLVLAISSHGVETTVPQVVPNGFFEQFV